MVKTSKRRWHRMRSMDDVKRELMRENRGLKRDLAEMDALVDKAVAVMADLRDAMKNVNAFLGQLDDSEVA